LRYRIVYAWKPNWVLSVVTDGSKNRLIKHALLLLFTALSAGSVFAAADHCAPEEKTIFSGDIRRSSRVLLICASKLLSKNEGYIQYRFGTPGKIELEYPDSREGSQSKFTYLHYFRANVDRTEVGFKKGQHEYSVFSDYEGDIKPLVNEKGVLISDFTTGKEKKILCKGKILNHLSALATVVPCAEEDSSGECQ